MNARLFRRVCRLTALLSLLGVISPVIAADERADQLPLALQELGVEASQALSEEDAQEVRGETFFYGALGTMLELSSVLHQEGGDMTLVGTLGGGVITMTASEVGFTFDTKGIAISGTMLYPPNRGILVTDTGVFDAQMLFEGDFWQMEILALPDQFGLDLR